MITATLTRPTTLAPTLQCDHKVYLLERIDISQLFPPRERTITLEPISRRNRAKTQAKKLVDSDRKSVKGDSSQPTTDREQSDSITTTSSPSLRAMVEVPQSPAPSDLSLDNGGRRSQPGSNTTSRPSQLDSNATSPRPSDLDSGATLPPSRTITATVASLSGGCLRGDTLSVKVHVNHTKHVKSLHGVIVTLYRQARVDMHPSIPLGPIEKGKERKYEDYYPKSMSGLGGLSLSGAGSNHVFRKDLSQTIVPLIVNPSSLTADVTGKVQVPDEAFPTISTVPGAMISFRYYVEVVLDIQGKLSSQDRNFGNLGGLASTMGQSQGAEPDRDRNGANGSGAAVIDTAAVRRDKGVVACTFEVVVGTRDTRRKGKKKVEVIPEADSERPNLPEANAQEGAASQPEDGTAWHDYAAAQAYHQQYYNAYPHAPGYDAHNDHEGYNGYGGYDGYHGSQASYTPDPNYSVLPPAPMPVIEDESQLPEKERLRRAEARLLPSQPPGFEASGPSESTNGATAPYLPEEQHNGYLQPNGHHHPPFLLTPPATSIPSYTDAQSIPLPRTPDYEPRNLHLPSTPAYEAQEDPLARIPTYEASQIPLPRTPAYEPTESEALVPTDDKRELQRRQLEMEASAPPQQDVDEPGPAPPHMFEPSAPVLTAEDGYFDTRAGAANDGHADAFAAPELPRYER